MNHRRHEAAAHDDESTEDRAMNVPQDLRYTTTHEWVKRDGDLVVVGITDHAQDQLGEVVFVELPETGRSVAPGDELGTLESVKAVSEFFAPVAGEVVEVNEALEDEPNLINSSAFGDGWLVKIRTTGDEGDTMDAAAYTAHVEEESH